MEGSNNSTVGNTSSHSDANLSSSIPALLWVIFLDILTFSGNSALIIAIATSKNLRSSLTYLFVLNLCLIDLLVSVVLLPAAAYGLYSQSENIPNALCQTTGILSTFGTIASILAICSISIERFYVIKLPMDYAIEMTLQRSMMILSYVLLQAVILAILPSIGWNRYEFQPGTGMCSFSASNQHGMHRVYVVLVFFFGFIMPGVIMLFMYYGIFKVAQSVALRVQPVPASLISTVIDPNTGRPDQYTSQLSTTSRAAATGEKETCMKGPFRKAQVVINPIEDSSWCAVETSGEFSNEDSVMQTSVSITTTNEQPKVLVQGTAVVYSKTTANMMASLSRSGSSALARVSTTATTTATATVTARATLRTTSVTPEPNMTASVATTNDVVPELKSESNTTPSTVQSDHLVTAVAAPVGPPSNPAKAAKTLAFIMLAYFVLWGPYFLVLLYSAATPGSGTDNQRILTAVTWLAYSSFALNPLLYGWLNRAVREEVVVGLRTHFNACVGVDSSEEEATHAPGQYEDFYEFLERTSACDISCRTSQMEMPNIANENAACRTGY